MNHARATFFYLLALFSLAFTAVGAGQILFQMVNKFLPEPAAGFAGDFMPEVLRFGISAVFVAGPVLWGVLRAANLGLERGEIRPDAPARRWISYLVIFIAAVAAVVDLVVALNGYLSGELTLRFFAKVLVILAISGAAGGYFALDLARGDEAARTPAIRRFSVGARMAWVAILLVGLGTAGSPAAARDAALDEARLRDLRDLDMAVNNFYAENGALPGDFAELLAEKKVFEKNLADETGRAFEFENLGGEDFRLCAEFLTEARERGEAGVWDAEWAHGAGRECFDRAVQPWAKENADRIAPLRRLPESAVVAPTPAPSL